jgi:antitoxin (DNA-binding transcriptional repressor) of toxin-antitoxin stability system
MTVVSLEEAQARLPELIGQVQQGEEVLITREEQAVARLVSTPPGSLPPRQPGSAVGKLTILSDDDEHLEDFREYMP